MLLMNHRSLFSLVGGLLLFLAPSFRRASAEELQAIWDFGAPALRAPQLDPNGLRINILYNVSDIIIPAMVAYNITNWDCEDSVEQWFVPSLISPDITFVQGDGSGDGVIELEINVDPNSFVDATGDIASFWQQDNQDRYQIMFCIFVGVQTMEAEPIVVDSSRTQIMVTYDLTDGFALEFEVTPVRRNNTATDGYGVEGFFCNDEGVELTDEEKDGMGTPGSDLQVCVIPDQRARESGSFLLDQIDLFEWIRTDPNGMEVRQVAVEDGQPPDPLTSLVCDEAGCKFVSLLKANFFQADLPTPAPTEAPTPAPTAPPPPGFDLLGDGYCTDNAGNRYDSYQATNYEGTPDQCPGQCSTLGSLLVSGGYSEEVRAFEHDGAGCRCLVDGGGGDRSLSGYTYTKAVGGTSAVSAVYTFQEQVDFRCYKYSTGSYTVKPYIQPAGSLSSYGSGGYCADSAGFQTDVIKIYDQNQLFFLDQVSCLNICEALLGNSFLGITIVRPELEPAPAGAPYTGAGNFPCHCHVPLNGASDPRIAYAENYNYPAGQGFADAVAAQPGTVVAGLGTIPSPGSWCFGYSPSNLYFAGEGICTDSDGNEYDYYQPPNGGLVVTDCPNQCQTLASLIGDAILPEAVRGYEYDGPSCRCLVDGGYGDRGFTGFTFTEAPETASAISPIVGVRPKGGVSCFKHQYEMYRPYSFLSYGGSLSSIGSGHCADSAGNKPDTIFLYDVNQRTGYDSTSCLALCESVLGTGLIGVTITRQTGQQEVEAPYTGLGNYQCGCHLLLNGPSDTRITDAQDFKYPSGQSFTDTGTVVDSNPGTAISTAVSSLGDICFAYAPPGLSFRGEGRCTDDISNQYDYYQLVNPTGDNVPDCPVKCDNLALQLDGFPEAVRGFEYNGPTCRCLVDTGYGDRSVTAFTFGAAAGVSAISPIISVTPLGGTTCYGSVYGRYRDYGGYSGYLQYMGTGYCADSLGAATDTINMYDAEQKQGNDPTECLNLCSSILGGAGLVMGVTMVRKPAETILSAPYTGIGNYQCQCHVDLSGSADPKIQSATGFQYRTGQGYIYSVFSQTGTGVLRTVASVGSTCYRYTASRRELQEMATINRAGMSDLISLDESLDDSPPSSYWSEEAAMSSQQQKQRFAVSSLPRPKDDGSFLPQAQPQPQLRRKLQKEGTTTIGGAGQATLKFARRVYRRNLLTGEDGWTTKIVKEQRKLQVGASEFNLELDITLIDYNRLYARGSSSSAWYSFPALLVTSVATVAVLLGGL